ncbi:MAG: galactokinase [Clostridia bacterium]|nr:galactokinase [Clostridia bacterium]
MKQIKSIKQIAPYFVDLYGKRNFKQYLRYQTLYKNFKKAFNKESAYFCSSSGRVELVGNHTDHNGGKVLACAVSLDVICAFLPCDDNKVVLRSSRTRVLSVDLDKIDKIDSGSIGLVKGVAKYFLDNGAKVGGFVGYTNSTIPTGAGLSSSASFELLVAQIFNHLYNDGKLSPEFLAKAGQYAENKYFGKASGLMDQSAVAVGGVVLFDFSNGFSYLKQENTLQQLDLEMVVVNTGGSHAQLNEHYSAIPSEMKAVANLLGADQLCELSLERIEENKEEIQKKLGSRPYLRAVHFFEENQRVERACLSLQNKDRSEFCQQLRQSGQSSIEKLQNCTLPNQTEQPIKEAVNFALSICPTSGSRVNGGGFAGTTINVVPSEQAQQFIDAMRKAYPKNVHVLKVRTLGTIVF